MPTCTRCLRDAGTGTFCPFCGAAAPSGVQSADPLIGTTIAQKYLIQEPVGAGGMGVVYRATHLSLDRPVALKMLNRALLADPTIVARFHREARAASRLNHPNSITILDFGQAEDGTLFMALEFLSGRTLARVIADEFPVGARRVVKIGTQILAALTEAHALGILHCDVKPENVMVESRHDEVDVVKVLDFGIAKLRDGSGGPRLTLDGMVCGTPGYSSPEQARGEELDARSDLYSAGVVLYELVSGKLPYEAPTPGALLAKMLVEQPVPLRVRRPDIMVPVALEAVIMRSISVDRADRFPSADQFRRALLACSETGERAVPVSGPQAAAVVEAPRRPTPASRPGEARRPTPRQRTSTGPSRRGVHEAASAFGIMVFSVLGALLLGAGVWYGLTWARPLAPAPASAQLEPERPRDAAPAGPPGPRSSSPSQAGAGPATHQPRP
jgi:serine/threonine protein kinase